MAITMQGAWTLRVSTRSSALPQRFVVIGADIGNGSHDGTTDHSAFVSGTQWSISLQHRPPGHTWRDSAQHIGFPVVIGGLLRFEIRADDHDAEDGDEPALVLECSLPASADDHILYGQARTYAGHCLFNPGRNDYIVIDPPCERGLLRARFPELGAVIDKLYPEPMVDDALRPLVIPTGLPNVANGLVFEAGAVPRLRRSGFAASALAAGAARLAESDFAVLAAVRDIGIRIRCEQQPAPGLLLRLQEYQRSDDESGGGPYTGLGERRDLGLAVTDAHGHYLFRFNPALHGDGGARPDVIVQLLGAGLVPSFESAPYHGVANLQRIDLSIPWKAAPPSRSAPAGGRLVRRISDVAPPPRWSAARPEPALAR